MLKVSGRNLYKEGIFTFLEVSTNHKEFILTITPPQSLFSLILNSKIIRLFPYTTMLKVSGRNLYKEGIFTFLEVSTHVTKNLYSQSLHHYSYSLLF